LSLTVILAIKIIVLCDVTPCGWLKINQPVRWTCRIQFQSKL